MVYPPSSAALQAGLVAACCTFASWALLLQGDISKLTLWLQGRLAAANVLALMAAGDGPEPPVLTAWENHGGYEFISGSAMLVRLMSCLEGALGMCVHTSGGHA